MFIVCLTVVMDFHLSSHTWLVLSLTSMYLLSSRKHGTRSNVGHLPSGPSGRRKISRVHRCDVSSRRGHLLHVRFHDSDA